MSRVFYWVFGVATAVLLLSPFLLPGIADWGYILERPLELLILLVPITLAILIPGVVYALSRNESRNPVLEKLRGGVVEALRKVRRGRPVRRNPAEVLKSIRRPPCQSATYHPRETPPLPLLPEPSVRLFAGLFAAAFVIAAALGLVITRGEFNWRLPAGVVVLTLAFYLPTILLLRRPWRSSPYARGLNAETSVGIRPMETSLMNLSKENWR